MLSAVRSSFLAAEVIQNLLIIAPWLKNRDPFLLVGPEGCGKGALLEYCFRRIMGVQVAVVNCSAQTSAANVVQKLVQVRPPMAGLKVACAGLQGCWGTVF